MIALVVAGVFTDRSRGRPSRDPSAARFPRRDRIETGRASRRSDRLAVGRRGYQVRRADTLGIAWVMSNSASYVLLTIGVIDLAWAAGWRGLPIVSGGTLDRGLVGDPVGESVRRRSAPARHRVRGLVRGARAPPRRRSVSAGWRHERDAVGLPDALGRPALRALAGPGRGAPAARPARRWRSTRSRDRLARGRPVPDGGRRAAVPARATRAWRLSRAQRPDLRDPRWPGRGLVPQPRRREPARGRGGAGRVPPAVLPGTHVGRHRCRLGRVPLRTGRPARSGGDLRRALPADRARGLGADRVARGLPHRPAAGCMPPIPTAGSHGRPSGTHPGRSNPPRPRSGPTPWPRPTGSRCPRPRRSSISRSVSTSRPGGRDPSVWPRLERSPDEITRGDSGGRRDLAADARTLPRRDEREGSRRSPGRGSGAGPRPRTARRPRASGRAPVGRPGRSRPRSRIRLRRQPGRFAATMPASRTAA